MFSLIFPVPFRPNACEHVTKISCSFWPLTCRNTIRNNHRTIAYTCSLVFNANIINEIILKWRKKKRNHKWIIHLKKVRRYVGRNVVEILMMMRTTGITKYCLTKIVTKKKRNEETKQNKQLLPKAKKLNLICVVFVLEMFLCVRSFSDSFYCHQQGCEN